MALAISSSNGLPARTLRGAIQQRTLRRSSSATTCSAAARSSLTWLTNRKRSDPLMQPSLAQIARPELCHSMSVDNWASPDGRSLAADLGAVLLVADVLEPGDVVAVEGLLQRDVHHVGAGAVPVLLAGRDPDGVAGTDLAHRRPPYLHASDAGDDVQRLAERMGVPGGAGLRLEPHEGAPDPRRRRRLDDRLLPHRAGERLRRSAARGRGAQRLDLHGCMSSAR